MPDVSLDTYPGKLPVFRGAHPADNFIVRHTTRLLAARFLNATIGESPETPPSGTPQNLEELTEGLEEIGIDQARITVGVAIAQLDLMRRFGVPDAAPRWTGPEDFGAEA